jgi:3-keto-5-aminohexanoate cleavage enzyme
MKPLVITATPNICWLNPREVDYPKTPEAIAEEAALCREAGAAILHTHAESLWKETIRAVKSKTDVIIQLGMSSLQIPERMEVFEENGEMISIILNHHDETFAETDCNVLHLKDELAEYARLCNEYGVMPEFEVWHSGSIWNLNYLLDNNILTVPYVTTLFFGWPGGTWSPPTIEEYLYRRKLMPAGCPITVSIMGAEQIKIVAAAILMGDNIRIGTEDYPYNVNGEIASTHELVAEAAELSRKLGRPLATPDEARRLLNVKGTSNG